ncbi:MAG: Gfo/Idh/MocA family oxidoreductase [Myxococcota bacterium]
MTLKVAIVGCGKIADGHVEEIQKLDDMAEVVATCDLEPTMADQLAVRYGIERSFADFDRMLEQVRPDVVHIATPPGAHLSLARTAIEAGCHVMVEKPLAMNLADSRSLIEWAEAHGKKLTIGWTMLFDPPALVMRELIEQGELGEPIHLESYYGYDLSGAFGRALLATGEHWVHRLPGRLLHNTIDHMFNKMVEFIDDDAPEVIATGYRLRDERMGDHRDDFHDELRLIVRGRRVSAYGTFSSHVKPLAHYCRVFGTKNILHVDYVSRTVTFDSKTQLPSAIGRLVPAFDSAVQYAQEGGRNLLRFAKSDFHFFAGLNELFRRFYGSIRDDTSPPIPYRDILRVAALHDATWAQLADSDARIARREAAQ